MKKTYTIGTIAAFIMIPAALIGTILLLIIEQ